LQHNHAIRYASSLKEKMAEIIPREQAFVKDLKEKYGEKSLGECTVGQAYGGMRSLKAMVWETSLLDPEEGIRFRGLSIPECQQKLVKAPGGEEPLPESVFWLLLTGECPTQEEVAGLTKDLMNRGKVDKWVTNLLLSLPRDLHPMTQFNIGINALQKESKFAAAYQEGVHKSKYWEYALEDSLDLIAKLPHICSTIYRHTYRESKLIAADKTTDWAANFAHQLGFDD